MKIAYVCNEYPPAPHGGIGTAVQSLARGLAARGHAVTVVGVAPPGMAGEATDAGVRVVRLPACGVRKVGWLIDRLRLRRCLQRLAAAGEVEVVEAADWQGGGWPSVRRVPTVVRLHGSEVTFNRLMGRGSPGLTRWIEGQALKGADGIVAASQFIARETASDHGLSEARMTVIPNTVDPRRFCPPPLESRNESLVVYVGTVTEKKGVVELIRAWPKVVERHPPANLAVVGRDGRHVATGRSLTAVLREMLPPEIVSSVNFTGVVPHDEVLGWYWSAALAVYPTFVEAMPLVWLEAMATGTPVVGSCMGPGPELIEEGRSGLLCNPRDPDELAARIVTCLDDPTLRSRLGAGARQRVEERFAPEVVLPQNEAFYQQMIRRERQWKPQPGVADCAR
jgi:glycosyltransferase involved in cell wall biosynthesis